MKMLPRNINRLLRSLQYFYGFHTGQVKLSYPPHTVVIEPTSTCNLKCSMCPHSFNRTWESGHMGLALFSKIVDEIKQYAFRVILQNRGESLLNKDFVTMVEICKNAGLDAGFNTNATVLNEAISQRLIEAGLDRMLFSFNGETRDVHNAVSQCDCYDKMLANIIGFLGIKKRLRARKPEVHIQVVKFLGASGESGRIEVSETFKKKFDGLPVDIIGSMWAINRSGDAKSKRDAPIAPPRSRRYLPCRWLWSEIVIARDGKVLPCCNDFNEDYVLGNVNEEPLLKIWNGPKMLKLRETLIRGNYADVDLCKNCDILWSVDKENSPVKQAAADLLRQFGKIFSGRLLRGGLPRTRVKGS